MTNDQQATEEPMPSSTASEQTGTQQVASTQVETEVATETSADGSDLKLPNDVPDRTAEQFEKLTESNRRLKEDMELLKNQSTQQPIEQPKTEEKPLYDPKTGYVDIEALEGIRKDAKEANERAKRAEENLTSSNAESQLRNLYSAYPELKNPGTDEQKEFFDESERIYMHAALHPDKYGGNALTQKEAADLAAKRLNRTETPEQAAETLDVKQQASLSATGKTSQGVGDAQTEENLEKLRLGTRHGDEESMTVRMRNLRTQGQTQN